MPNIRLPKARLRRAKRMFLTGSIVALFALFVLCAYTKWLGWIVCGGGLLLAMSGSLTGTNKLRCPGCGRTFWLMGEGGRSNWFCGAAYFDGPESTE